MFTLGSASLHCQCDIRRARINANEPAAVAVCLHAGHEAGGAGERALALETAQCAIALAGWFAGRQLEILAGSRMASERARKDEVFALLVDTPTGITARDVQRARIAPTAEDAPALLAQTEAEGELDGQDSKSDGGGHVTRIYTNGRGKLSVTSVTSVTRV